MKSFITCGVWCGRGVGEIRVKFMGRLTLAVGTTWMLPPRDIGRTEIAPSRCWATCGASFAGTLAHLVIWLGPVYFATWQYRKGHK